MKDSSKKGTILPNLLKRKENNPTGGALKHGARSRHIRARYSDLRTSEGKQLRAVIKELVDDLGGTPNLSAGQLLILDRVREKVITLQQIGRYVDRQPSVITEKGELLPCLGRGYTTYAESLRRDIELLYSLASKRPSRAPSLEEYLRARKAESEPRKREEKDSSNGAGKKQVEKQEAVEVSRPVETGREDEA